MNCSPPVAAQFYFPQRRSLLRSVGLNSVRSHIAYREHWHHEESQPSDGNLPLVGPADDDEYDFHDPISTKSQWMPHFAAATAAAHAPMTATDRSAHLLLSSSVYSSSKMVRTATHSHTR